MNLKKQHTGIYRQLIRFFRQTEQQDTPEAMEHVWQEITQRVAKDKQKESRKRFLWYTGSVAAILTGLIFGINYFYSLENQSVLYELAQQWQNEETEEIRLVVANTQEQILPSDTIISYAGNRLSEQLIQSDKKIVPENQETLYDRIIVPKGKRINVVLSDGTRMWVNSGTRVIYPQEFTGKNREIFTDGEIYLEVFPDKDKPFIVRTGKFEVEVLGTSFNICAYQQFTQSVVLIEGSVDIKHTTGKHQLLQPDEQVLVFDDYLGDPIRVNAQDYIGWINNLLILRSESLETVCKRLYLYYGTEFILDGNFSDITLSGKIDLKDDLLDIVRSLTKTAPVGYTIKEGKIVMTNNDQ